MRKKLLASVLVAAMAITMLAGCGSTDDNTTGSTALQHPPQKAQQLLQ